MVYNFYATRESRSIGKKPTSVNATKQIGGKRSKNYWEQFDAGLEEQKDGTSGR